MNNKSLLYLSEERTLFIGRLDEPIFLSQGAATLTIALEGSCLVTVMDTGATFESSSVLLHPGCSTHLETRNQLVANLNLDVTGRDFYILSCLMKNVAHGVHSGLSDESVFKAFFWEIFKRALCLEKTTVLINDFFFSCKPKDFDFEVDERVLKVLQIIRASIDKNLSIESLADSINLSVPALTRIFKKQTGVPIRRYRQWHRLFITGVEVGRGKSLTDAALIAGFVDLSHCTHTFNSMLGVRPSYFLSRPEAIKVLAGRSY